jgi:hypothetical protein
MTTKPDVLECDTESISDGVTGFSAIKKIAKKSMKEMIITPWIRSVITDAGNPAAMVYDIVTSATTQRTTLRV